MIDKNIEIINSLIIKSNNNELIELLPITTDKLKTDEILCETIMDYLGDIYVTIGFDENYCENNFGKLISNAIDFVVRCSPY